MDTNKVFNFQLIAILFTIIIGTILHFTYNLLGNSNFIALFSAVNESTWEHLKLIFFSMMIFAIIEYFFIGKDANNYFLAKCLGVIVGMLSIVVMFYTYTGIIGTNFFVLDIFVFIFGVIIAECTAYKFMIMDNKSNKITQILSIICVILIAIMFFIYTYNPPQIPLFLDPVKDTYGIPKL